MVKKLVSFYFLLIFYSIFFKIWAAHNCPDTFVKIFIDYDLWIKKRLLCIILTSTVDTSLILLFLTLNFYKINSC